MEQVSNTFHNSRFREATLFYAGWDIHTTHIAICILNSDGKVFQRRQVRKVNEMISVLEKLPDRFAVCYEASTGYGRYYEWLTKIASHVAVAHPGLLRPIFRSKKKNDRADAEKLAKLLFLDEVPTVHVPSTSVRAWRELISFRRKLTEKRTRAKNGIRASLRSVGIFAPRRPGL